MKTLMLVNKRFHGIIQAISHRHHKIILSGTIRRSLDCQKKLQEATVLQNLRHLTVQSCGPWAENWEYPSSTASYDDFLEQFEPFNDYIRSISALKSLSWNAGPVPETLLTTLKAFHPHVKLKVLDFTRFQGHFKDLDKGETALSECQMLTHIRFGAGKTILWDRDADDEETSISNAQNSWGGMAREDDLEVFLRIISNAPKLEYAGFVSTSPLDVVFPERVFCQKHPTSKTIKSLTLDGKFTINKAMLVELNDYIDLGQVNTLKFSRGTFERDFFQSAQYFLTKLQHISLNLKALFYMDEQAQSEFRVSVKRFFLQCSPLQTISVWSWSKAIDLDDILSRHGTELRTLQLHERADRWTIYDDERPVPARVFTLAELKAIRQSCAKLTDLTVDLRLNKATAIGAQSAELLAKLDELASFEAPLHIIRLYYPEIDVDADDVEVQTLVTSIWKQIYTGKTVGQRRLDIKFGEWEPRQWRAVATDGRRFYQVTPHERDDMLGECKVIYHKKNRL